MITREFKLKYKVFIPTAGIGERLEEKTKYLNKSLVEINNRPIISHIIEKFDLRQEFVIAVGYKAKLVKDYLKVAHPNRIIKFVKIKNFIGKDSGLGLTMLCSKKFLQSPFIFFSCDSFIENKLIPKPDMNWMGYSKNCNTKLYRTIIFKQGVVKNILEKKTKFKNAKNYIGVCGIKNYKEFWNSMKNSKKTIKEGEVFGMKKILKTQKIFSKNFNWHDCGSLKSLKNIEKKFKNNSLNILPKETESIWFVNNKVVKFSNDRDFIKKRVKRQKILSNYTPKIIDSKENFYTYKIIQGKIFSKIKNKKNFNSLMNYLKNFWKFKKLKKNDLLKFNKLCLKFYKEKTYERIKLFNKKLKIKDDYNIINNQRVPHLKTIFNRIDWKNLSKGVPVNFHGDLHFENILVTDKDRFTLLDWRQDFSGNLLYGDIYYDLAKLMHGMIISHNIITNNDFKIKLNNRNKNILYSFHHELINKEILKDFEKWIKFNGYDLKKVKILTGLIFLNIAPLHHYPYSLFLYYLGKNILYNEVKYEN